LESHTGHGGLTAVSVACRQVEVSATGLSLVQRGPAECGVSEWSLWTSSARALGPLWLSSHADKNVKVRVRNNALCIIFISQFRRYQNDRS